MYSKYLLFCIFYIICMVIASDKLDENTNDCTDVARDDERLLVFSTLGGGLTAIDPVTSEIRWKIDDEPAIKVPTSNEFSIPQYLPDPRDGTLYQLGGMGGLKKLPYTIPQLVASAPCRSSDGILYSGKKSDTWFLIDPKTGRRQNVLGFGVPSSESIGWATSRAIYLGRTQYTVLMYDSSIKTKNMSPWNVTFYDYSSISMAPELYKNYEWLHLSSSSSGLTVTLNRNKGSILWQKDLASPVVAVFLLGPEGLLNIPFTTMSDEALRNVIDYAKDGTKADFNLFQTLYVGENIHGIYAIPSLADKNTATISSEPPIRLIEGPIDKNDVDNQNLVYLNNFLTPKSENNNIIIFGYYQPPPEKEIKYSNINLNRNMEENQIISMQEFPLIGQETNGSINILHVEDTTLHTNKIENNDNKSHPVLRPDSHEFLKNIYFRIKYYINSQENRILKLLLIILIGVIIALFWYTRNAVQELRKQSQNGSKTSNRSNSSNFTDLEEFGDSEYKIGKICFNPNEVIGKGCEGTFVFKGTFEKRDVAVKRLLPECFTLADREVSLLRESDTHENVVRYFCTEQDRQFRYIAVELCAATLQDYTEGYQAADFKSKIAELEVLKQATKGLVHLHSLNIVHRDIKPQNVLISFPDAHNRIRVMISDFGLCKKLNFGRASFSRRSGITGTEGWIAPEMLKGQRTTTSVDIFSLGCVFYYVLSKGSHPFGEPMKRQANILSNEIDLHYLCRAKPTNTEILSEELIRDMINHNSLRRPSAQAVRNHPLFWSEERVLSFLQDVSDRVEKTNSTFMEPLRWLEKNAKFVVREDWNLHLDYTVTEDMKKYRGYQGGSVRDLLRAIRNKKHHYHELDKEIQSELGALPIQFTRYWLQRFPHLLSHSFHALDLCSKEESFKTYYPESSNFSRPSYFDVPGNEESFYALIANIKPTNASPRKNANENRSSNFMNYRNNKNENFRFRKGAYNFHKNSIENAASIENILDDNISNKIKNNSESHLRRNQQKQMNANNQGNSNTVWTIPNQNT